MAVFTRVSEQEAKRILASYELGELVSLREISEGIENTNYFLDTSDTDGSTHHWVLTIFENIDDHELPFFCGLTRHLAEDGLAVPAPQARKGGSYLFDFEGKQGLIVPRFSGHSEPNPSTEHCFLAGEWMANMHRSLVGFSGHRPLVRNLEWMQSNADQVREDLGTDELAELESAIQGYAEKQALMEQCPQGLVHGDLFRDNVLFDQAGERLSIAGVIDFYNASDASLIYDLAVAVNDWCTNESGQYLDDKRTAMLEGYQSLRPFTAAEHQAWPYCLELAALRFWISRLVSKHAAGYQSQAVSGETIKDPDEMKRIMRSARAEHMGAC